MRLAEKHIYFYEDISQLIGFIALKNFSNIFVLTDKNVITNCLPLFYNVLGLHNATVIEIPFGEENKNLATLELIWKEMQIADRNALLINFGGGVITDMGGLAASLFKRGVAFINVPTSLLSMADASVGGKTGINFNHLKNNIGLYSNALATFIYPQFLQTLPKRQLLSGMAEIVKVGFIADSELFEMCQHFDAEGLVLEQIIKKAVIAKIKIVEADPTEHSIRKLLNFGHTIGHAIESFSLDNHKNYLLHGEAIALGMIAEAYIATELNKLKYNELNELKIVLMRLLPVDFSFHFNESLLLAYMKNDKKNLHNSINFTLPTGIGKGEIDCYPSWNLISKSIEFLNSL